MPWFVSDQQKYAHAIREIKKQRDRGAGLIATTILQEHLIGAIKARLERHENIERELFKSSGPLGSFATQIDVGLLLGLYPPYIHKQLHTMRLIRNDFAHSVHPVSFRSQRERCATLRPPLSATRKLNQNLSKTFSKATNQPISFTFARSSSNPRTQFLEAAQQITMYLSLNMVLSNMAGPWGKVPGKAAQPVATLKAAAETARLASVGK